MTIPNRDIQILQKIQGYCDDIMFTHTEYDRNYNTFCSNPTYRNAIALCLLQIGELVKKLSDEFVQSHTCLLYTSQPTTCALRRNGTEQYKTEIWFS